MNKKKSISISKYYKKNNKLPGNKLNKTIVKRGGGGSFNSNSIYNSSNINTNNFSRRQFGNNENSIMTNSNESISEIFARLDLQKQEIIDLNNKI